MHLTKQSLEELKLDIADSFSFINFMFKSIRKILIIGRILSLALSGLLFPAHAINAQVLENQIMVKQPVVAIIDEGVNFNHPDLVNSNWLQ